MLEVRLRPDGSVSDAVVHPRIDAVSLPRTETSLLPLDGLPRSIAFRPTGRTEEDRPDSWAGGFAFAVRDRRRETLCAYRGHYGARPPFYHQAPRCLLVASELPALLRKLPAPAPLDEGTGAEDPPPGGPAERTT